MMNEDTSPLPECPVFEFDRDSHSEDRSKAEPFPPEFAGLVDQSVENFKKALPVMLRSFAEQQGWVEQYRQEVHRVIREVLDHK